MALPGLRSTADMGTDGRPKNWRQGIMLDHYRNDAPLFRMTNGMSSEMTDDPEFSWWNESVDSLIYTVNGAVASTSEETVVFDERADRLKTGDMFYNENTGEFLRVISVTNSTTAELERGVANSTAVNIGDGDVFTYVGSAFREGAPKATGTSFNPTKAYNFTQIFRDPIEWTRTAMKTKLRYTSDIMKEDRRRTSHKHSIGIERAFWLGARYETMESSQPLRFTGGIIQAIPAANKQAVQGAGGFLDYDEFESYFPRIFEYGSDEKLGFASIQVLSHLSTLVRKNSKIEVMPVAKEFGMNIRRFVTPAGTLALTEHPLFGRGGGFLADSLVIVDTAKFKYRYITDTVLLKDREDRGTDGKSEEYLTECGLEYHNTETFFQLSGILGAQADS